MIFAVEPSRLPIFPALLLKDKVIIKTQREASFSDNTFILLRLFPKRQGTRGVYSTIDQLFTTGSVFGYPRQILMPDEQKQEAEDLPGKLVTEFYLIQSFYMQRLRK